MNYVIGTPEYIRLLSMAVDSALGWPRAHPAGDAAVRRVGGGEHAPQALVRTARQGRIRRHPTDSTRAAYAADEAVRRLEDVVVNIERQAVRISSTYARPLGPEWEAPL